MKDLSYCEDCGNEEHDCVCDVIEYLEESNADFRFEYAHEMVCNPYNTLFKQIPPDYD